MLLGLGQEKYQHNSLRSTCASLGTYMIFFLTQAQQHGNGLVRFFFKEKKLFF